MFAFSNERWRLQFITVIVFICCIRVSSAGCPSHQFQCGNGRCIPLTWHCDEDNDCGDNTDESSCELRTCSETELKCQNSKCVPIRWICDNEDDCGDKTDEDPKHCQNKTCAADQFSCGGSSGSQCIPISWRCDGQEDCADGSDEKEECRQITCTEEEFTCENNKCITKRWRCDQDNDCGDFSDEKNCPNVTCSESEFMCINGKCIPDRWRCDGDVDCLDGSDEATCPKTTLQAHSCSPTEYMCKNRDCIHAGWVCDGDADCPDKSDELNCTVTCRTNQFQCINNRCIAGVLQCNGKDDCNDNSDEVNCPTLVPAACDLTTQFDCGGKHCIPVELACNGKNDCGDWEDEPTGKCFVNECTSNNGGCSQKCVDDVIGFHCDCFSGYKLLDNQTCEDIDECEIHGSCSQLCNNTKGSFKCSCLENYSIEPSNQRRCKAQLGHAALLFANRRDLRKIDLETSEYTLVASGLRSAVAIDYDYAKDIVVWTDVLEGRIYSAPLKTGTPITQIGGKAITPDGVAVDWIHGNVYWTDTGENSINVAQMRGTAMRMLFKKDLDEPRAIVVDPLEGWMFWADWGVAKIERSGMDGTHRSVVVSKDIQWPNGLAIDLVSRKIFWADAKLHVLSCANYDGSSQQVVLSEPTEVKHPFSLDVFEDWLYWTDWESESIYKVDKFTGKDAQSVAGAVSSPMGVRVYHSYKQPKGPNRCGDLNGGCSHLCLPAPHLSEGSSKYTCACPNGMVLSDNGLNCLTIDIPTTRPTTITYTTTRRNYASTTPQPRTTHRPTSSTRKHHTTTSTHKHHTTTPTRKSHTTTPTRKSHTTPSTRKFHTTTSTPRHYPATSAKKHTTKEPTDFTTTETPTSPSFSISYNNIPTPLAAGQSTLMNATLREIREVIDDSGRIAGIIIGVLSGLTIVLALVGFCVYKQYLRRSITSMNFDNPVYRKTTEDQFSLEKNQYQPARSYPSSLEPLTSPGTNEFV